MADDPPAEDNFQPPDSHSYPLVKTRKVTWRQPEPPGSLIPGPLSALPSWLPDTWESPDYPAEDTVEAILQWLDFEITVARCMNESDNRESIDCDWAIRDAYRIAEHLRKKGWARLTGKQDGPFRPVKAQEELWRIRDWVEEVAPEGNASTGEDSNHDRSDQPTQITEDGNSSHKRSTEKNEARIKIISGLTKHHGYQNGSCSNSEPVVGNQLARDVEVSNGSVSNFFKKEFGGHSKYRAVCHHSQKLVGALKLLNNEYTPNILFGRNPPNEGDAHDDE